MPEVLDLRGTLCPLNYVCTKLRLEEMEPGEVLEVILDDGEPMRNVPRSLKQDGHRITRCQKLGSDTYKLTILCGDP